jgi:hypothetical protein
MAGGVAQAIECLVYKYEDLSSNTIPSKKKKKGREREREREKTTTRDLKIPFFFSHSSASSCISQSV